MPTLEVRKKDFEKLLGKKLSKKEIEETVEYVKGELEGFEDGMLKIDCKETNRPDLWSAEGLAREIKPRIGKERGIKKYLVKKSNIDVFINENLKQVRPLIVCALVKGVRVDDDFIKQIVQLQEKVGDTFGRRRKEAGIGLYDFDKMKHPIYYKGFKDDEIEFVPLEWKVPMRPTEILSQHDKGKAYKHLLDNVNCYPIVIDSNKTVASMPPIINSETTGKITEKTKNIFIEVTGFDFGIIETCLEVICMALADRGGKIFSCKINFPKGKEYPKTLQTPVFGTEKISFKKSLIKKKTGLDLKDSQIKELLEKARYDTKIKNKMVTVEYPSYRKDIMHGVDVIEDLLISYGYNNIIPNKLEMSVIGSQRKESLYTEFVKEGAIGLGLQEILTYNMTSKEKQAEKILVKDDFVEIANPVSINASIMRKRLLPELLSFISKNKNQEFPQKIFEIGTCLSIDPKEEDGIKQSNNICITITHSKTNFTEIKSVLSSLCDYLGIKFDITKKQFPFLGKNSAEIIVNGKKGFIGELNKEVEKSFGLKKTVTVLEFEL